jgi:hypothetical protein
MTTVVDDHDEAAFPATIFKSSSYIFPENPHVAQAESAIRTPRPGPLRESGPVLERC